MRVNMHRSVSLCTYKYTRSLTVSISLVLSLAPPQKNPDPIFTWSSAARVAEIAAFVWGLFSHKKQFTPRFVCSVDQLVIYLFTFVDTPLSLNLQRYQANLHLYNAARFQMTIEPLPSFCFSGHLIDCIKRIFFIWSTALNKEILQFPNTGEITFPCDVTGRRLHLSLWTDHRRISRLFQSQMAPWESQLTQFGLTKMHLHIMTEIPMLHSVLTV